MRRKSKAFIAGTLGVIMAFQPVSATLLPCLIDAAAEETFSSCWFQDEAGNWKVKDSSGNLVTNAWLCDDAVSGNGQDVWYLLGPDGNMISAPLVQDKTGNFYSLEQNHNGYYGMLRYTDGTYDDVALTFEREHNGSFAKILNEDGLALMTERYGVTVVEIDNSNCIYTSSFVGHQETGIDVQVGPSSSSSGSGGGSFSGSTGSVHHSGGGSNGGSSGGSGGNSGGNSWTDSDDGWEDYGDENIPTSKTANDFENGNYGEMSSSERMAVNDAIDTFIAENDIMTKSDFEKEIAIIGWLVENCSYKVGNGWENATAYSCIVNGKAQCSGYADAFLQTAKKAGLGVRYVYNSTHAWNLVRLDGDWYHVDVTWEDPIGSNDYKTGHLWNKYINLKDSEIRTVRSHASWSKSTIKATGDAYTQSVVEYYLREKKVDTDMKGDKWRKYLMHCEPYSELSSMLHSYGMRFDSGENWITGEGDAEKAAKFLDSWFLSPDDYPYAYLTGANSKTMEWLDADWLFMNLGMSRDSWHIYRSTCKQDGKDISYCRIEKPENYVGKAAQEEQNRILLEKFRSSGTLFDGKTSKETIRNNVAKQIQDQKWGQETQNQVKIEIAFEGADIPYALADLKSDFGDDMRMSQQSKLSIMSDGKEYTIVTFTVVCKTLDNRFGTLAMDGDWLNVFSSEGKNKHGESVDDYLRTLAAKEASVISLIQEDDPDCAKGEEFEEKIMNAVELEGKECFSPSGQKPIVVTYFGKTYSLYQFLLRFKTTRLAPGEDETVAVVPDVYTVDTASGK